MNMQTLQNIRKKITALLLLTFTFLTWDLPVWAQTSGTGITNPITGNLGNDPDAASSGETFVGYFVDLWNSVISIGGFIVLIYFLWGALEWITAGGDAGKIEKARSRITQSIIGLLILVSSFIIIGFISQLFFGEEFSLLNLTFTSPGGTP